MPERDNQKGREQDMDNRKNAFKAAMARGETQMGVWCSLCSPLVAEILGQSAFDWVCLDTEHSPIEVAGVLPLLQAVGDDKNVLARPAWNDPVLIKKMLDLGAQTLVLPYVQTPKEAAEAVAACRYPPQGIRGVAGGTRAAGYGRRKSYLGEAYDEICVIVQVETTSALDQLAEIAAVDGIDGVFIGPADLSASMGHLGNPAHPEVQDALRAAVAVIEAAGKAPGTLATNATDARRYRDWGYRFVAASIDSVLLVGACDALAAEFSES